MRLILQSFEDIPIKRKVAQIIMIASTFTLLLASGTLFIFQWESARRTVKRDLQLQADIIASYSSTALIQKDKQAATRMLFPLNANANIISAGLYLPGGDVLAFYGYAASDPSRLPDPVNEGFRFEGPHLVLCHPVIVDTRRVGTLLLRGNYRMMDEREIIAPFPMIMASILLVALALAILLSSILQRVVSEPLLRLADIARTVAASNDYSVRAGRDGRAGRDEIGMLTQAFNQMLARIHEQDVALRVSEGRYRLLFDRNPMPMFVYDEETLEFLAANEAATRHYGYSVEEFQGMTLRKIWAPQDATHSADSFGADRDQVTFTRMCQHLLRDGRLIQVEATAHLIEFFGRRARLTLCNDITARKLAEDRLTLAFDELEIRVEERTRELREATQVAESASQAKSRFLAVMSHEIRTPLNGVTGVLRLLQRGPLTPQQSRWIGMALASADTLLRVINDILDFSKVEAGKLGLHACVFPLSRTVEQIAGAHAEKAREKGLSWQVAVDPAVPEYVLGDPDRFAQVLVNLLSNATKFTDAGSIGLRVLVAESSAEGDRIRFVVTDTGVGIEREQQAVLFKPFSQVDSSSTRRHGGTGLGLGICKQLVELMGGAIGFDSVVGAGSTFWFELPFPRAAGSAQTPGPRVAGTAHHVPGAWGGVGDDGPPLEGRVLLAEDNEINQELAREMVLTTGCTCDCVSNGVEVIQAVREQRYDLVFMDCMMPIMDGYEATRSIRDAERARAAKGEAVRRLPIVAMTANAMRGDREIRLAAGMDDYLSKPLSPPEVAAVVRRWLERRGTAGTTDGAAGSGEVARPS